MATFAMAAGPGVEPDPARAPDGGLDSAQEGPAAAGEGTSPPSAEHAFNKRLDRAMLASGSLLCVGLDPHPGRFEGSMGDFCRRTIDATADFVVAYKPNIAFFEASGTDGLAVLATVIDHVPDGCLVILDAKRGDIGSTADAYARAVFDVLGADAVTVNPYLGGDAVAPFLVHEDRGAFVLCHTSNPGAGDIQGLEVNGEPLYLSVARMAAAWNGSGNVGLVVGATYPDAIAAVRRAAPDLPFLVPGIGAQGGDLQATLAAGLDANGRGLVINSSRGIIFATDPGTEARLIRDAINEARAAAR